MGGREPVLFAVVLAKLRIVVKAIERRVLLSSNRLKPGSGRCMRAAPGHIKVSITPPSTRKAAPVVADA